MTTNGLFTLDWKSIIRGLVVAIFTGIALPISEAVQTPGFNIATVNWNGVWVLALNGAIVGFVGYVVKNFISDNQGHVLGSTKL